jgi:hypothetical protein
MARVDAKRQRFASARLVISNFAPVRTWLKSLSILPCQLFLHIFMLASCFIFNFSQTSKNHYKLKINPNDLQFFAL